MAIDRTPSSPIGKLPNEVLLIIFDFACDTSRPLDGFDRETFKTPFRLGCTSASWRALLNSTPTLWTCIALEKTVDDLILSLFLERSREAPLNVRMAHSMSVSVDGLKSLFDTCYRWRSLRNDIRADPESRHIQVAAEEALEKCGLPVLEWADLNFNMSSYFPLAAILPKAPRLHSIYIGSFSSFPPGANETLSSQVRQIGGPGACDAIYGGLHKYASETGTHLLFSKAYNYGFNASPRVLLSVTALTVNLAPWLYNYFGSITIPTLTDLTLVMQERSFNSDSQNSESAKIAHIPIFIARSECSLTAFRVVMKKRDKAVALQFFRKADDLLSLLDAMPDLDTLHIIESAPILLTKPFFERLVTPTFLPNLTDVKLVWMPQERGRNVVLVGVQKLVMKFLDARTGGAESEMNLSRLTKVILGLRQGVELPSQLVRRVGKLREDGVTAWVW